MAVSLPTAADVRKAREQAAKAAAERAELARTPLLAALGAGDLALATVTRVAADVRSRAAEARTRAGGVQHTVAELPQLLRGEDLRDDVRRAMADLQKQLELAYVDFARRGAATWGKIRKQPQVKQAIATLEEYTEKLDAQVDGWVDDAHDAAEKALEAVTRQTRSTGERVARATQRYSGQAAETVTEVSRDASRTVAEAGAELAEDISDAGAEAARETRSASRRAANRTAPKDGVTDATTLAVTKPAARKPAARRTTAGGTGKSSS